MDLILQPFFRYIFIQISSKKVYESFSLCLKKSQVRLVFWLLNTNAWILYSVRAMIVLADFQKHHFEFFGLWPRFLVRVRDERTRILFGNMFSNKNRTRTWKIFEIENKNRTRTKNISETENENRKRTKKICVFFHPWSELNWITP